VSYSSNTRRRRASGLGRSRPGSTGRRGAGFGEAGAGFKAGAGAAGHVIFEVMEYG